MAYIRCRISQNQLFCYHGSQVWQQSRALLRVGCIECKSGRIDRYVVILARLELIWLSNRYIGK